MPPILLSPLVKWTLAAVGGAMVVHWVVKEVRRINEELDAAKRVRVTDDRTAADVAARSGDRRISPLGEQVQRRASASVRAADESGEKQQQQRQSDQLKRQHCGSSPRTAICAARS